MIRRGLACALALLPTFAFSQTVCSWTTDDDFILNTTTDASAATVIADPGAGVEYAAGMSSDAATGHWVVRKRHSGTWSTVDDFIYSIGLRNAPRAMLRDPGGRIVVVGGANNLSNLGHWLVRQSSNAGSTWSTVDDFSDPTVAASAAMAVTADGSGLLVGGWHNEAAAPAGYHWVTRKGTNQGSVWTTSFDLSPTAYSAGVTALDTDPSGTIYAVGYNFDGYGTHWQIRKRTATGTTWTLVDDQPPTTYGIIPVAVVAPASNVVYVAGYNWPLLNGPATWIVRKSTNGGTTWTTVDSFSNGGQTCAARAIGWSPQDSSLYVSGRCNGGGAYHWITRRTANGGTSWTTDDDYQLSPTAHSYPNGINATSGGHVYAAGMGNDGTHTHWIIRRRACNAIAPLAPVSSGTQSSGTGFTGQLSAPTSTQSRKQSGGALPPKLLP